MTRRILALVMLSILAVFSMGTNPSVSAATTQKQIKQLVPKVSITSIKLLSTGCGVEFDCVEVKWDVQFPPANPLGMSFEVNGSLITASNPSGTCKSDIIKINNHTVRIAKLGFFQSSPCGGLIKSANVTVKLFTRDVEGQRVLTSTDSKSQTI